MKLKDILEGCLFTDGDWIESKDQDPLGEIRLIQLADIGDGFFVDKSSRFINKETAKRLRCTFLKKNDLLIARMPDPLGRACVFPLEENEKFVTAVDVCIIRPQENCDNRYLQYCINSTDIRNSIERQKTGTTRERITRKKLGELEIPFPSLPQQQKIAAILDAADALRQNDKALIAKYDELTQALFLDMFGDPVSNPKGFELSTVGTQCNVKGGKRVPKEEKLVSENTGFPYIKAGNIKAGKVTLKNLEYLLPQTREKIKRYTVESGDVCITVVGANIGDIGVVPQELHLANLTENANKILIKNKSLLNSTYLAKYLQMDFVQKNISAKTMAVGVPKLALFRIEQIELLIPPVFLQNQYQERITLIEEQRAIAQASVVKSEELFNSLLQKAFKGELV